MPGCHSQTISDSVQSRASSSGGTAINNLCRHGGDYDDCIKITASLLVGTAMCASFEGIWHSHYNSAAAAELQAEVARG